jgi:thioredoxin-related protein
MKLAISSIFANSVFLQAAAQEFSPLAQLSGWASMLLACWSILRSVVHVTSNDSRIKNLGKLSIIIKNETCEFCSNLDGLEMR